jgi:hypothetical protein
MNHRADGEASTNEEGACCLADGPRRVRRQPDGSRPELSSRSAGIRRDMDGGCPWRGPRSGLHGSVRRWQLDHRTSELLVGGGRVAVGGLRWMGKGRRSALSCWPGRHFSDTWHEAGWLVDGFAAGFNCRAVGDARITAHAVRVAGDAHGRLACDLFRPSERTIDSSSWLLSSHDAGAPDAPSPSERQELP